LGFLKKPSLYLSASKLNGGRGSIVKAIEDVVADPATLAHLGLRDED
jgi:hypothetical protein